MKRINKLLIIALVLFLTSAKSDDRIELANKYKQNKNYSKAIELYENLRTQSLKEGNETLTKNFTKELGLIHFQLRNYVKSEWYFDQLIGDDNCEALVIFKYAQLQQINGRYDKAIQYFNRWGIANQNQELANSYSYFSDLLKNGNSSKTKVYSMPFNTKKFDEYSATVTNGKLIFSSNKLSDNESIKNDLGIYFSDLYQSSNLDFKGDNSTILFSKSLKSIYNESSATFTKDGETIYFTGNNLLSGNESSQLALCIYMSHFDGYKWSKPQKLNFIEANHNYAFPALSANGKVLYFASDIPNGFGGMDIYKSEFNGEEWSSPVNLGEYINSSENDVYPFVLDDSPEGTLFYSTNGKPGFGGLDIFYSPLSGGDAVKMAEILENPINSTSDDFGYWASNNNLFGYISSNREGSDDIYYFKKSDESSTTEETKIVYLDKQTTETKTEVAPEIKIVTKTIEEKEEVEVEEKVLPKEESIKPDKEVIKEEVKEESKKSPTAQKESKVKPKKETRPSPKGEPAPKKIEVVNSDIIDATSVKNHYMITYSTYSKSEAQRMRDLKYKEADIIQSENNFYMVGYKLDEDVDKAYSQFKERQITYPKGWFYYPKP